ncbi:uncharacterized protein LOC105835782 [Monomorium pharaonis]|uniref:uncharacterized protein LOC105835782 n=1 Tax=Monomorium pharaonis TaxID=307658 RepID=UPI0017470882|nr:uncharacterized protein LOC105835782 [Monomorium pharaonis]
MKILFSLMVIMILRQAIAGIVRKPPAFSTPVYSNAYLPAALQVIFHAVEQLKMLEAEEILQEVLVISPSTSTTQSMKQQQPQSTTPKGISITSTARTTKIYDKRTEIPIMSTSTLISKISSQGSSKTYDQTTEIAQRLVTSTASVVSDYKETPEVNEETTEMNYELPGTPEVNHESPELVHETQELNQEVPEKNEENSNVERSFDDVSKTPRYDGESQQQSTQVFTTQVSNDQKKKEPTVDSVVDKIHEIVKTTTSLFVEESDDTESKSVETSIEKSENIEDEEEETRFCLLGERVAQVPRPSLSNYLRRSKVPPKPSLQQLANLYDSLSKDARKQGFARFAGYTDEVLKILYSSAEGGIGPQLKQLLEKVIERNELTRDDAKLRTSQALRDLNNPGSSLSKDLRPLLPLRYTL